MKMAVLLLHMVMTGVVYGKMCRILALEGGGSRGAYQAGVIQTMTEVLPRREVEWDVVSGVSTGALNTCGCLQFEKGREKEMSQFLVQTWKSINGTETAYKKWPYGYLESFLFRASLYDSSPLASFITSHYQHGLHRHFTIAATDFNTASLRVFTDEMTSAEVPEAVLSSAAPPFFFLPRHYENTIYVDGGCLVNLDVASPVRRCVDLGYEMEEIEVDIVLLTASRISKAPGKWTPLNVHHRTKEIRKLDEQTWFVYYAKLAFPQVHFRYTFIPSVEMAGGEIPLDFDRDNILSEIQLGQKDAFDVISKGKNGLTPMEKPGKEKKVRSFRGRQG